MAKGGIDAGSVCRTLVAEAKSGVFKPVYLLMGDEPYYPELLCQTVIDNCVDEFAKDFNETVCYGSDVTSEQIITAARRFPMMSERQLVVVKEAQMLKDIENLAVYCSDPLDSTVLVILLHKATVDKRRALYKAVQKCGAVLDSPAIRDYETAGWISRYYASRGLDIEPDAAALLGECVGTDLSAIVVETEKLLKNLPEGCRVITAADVERNVGVSRQFSIFELTKELSMKNSAKALKIAAHIGSAARFAMPMAVSALYTHFNRILKYDALLSSKRRPSDEEKAEALAGVNPYFYREYDTAARNYPLPKAMDIISLLADYDYKGKGGDAGSATPGELLTELVVKILNC